MAATILCSCHNKKNNNDEAVGIEINEQSVTDFAKSIERGLWNGQADALNKVIDAAHIQQLVCENSIVYSGFDVEGGKAYFNSCLHLGERILDILNRGGDLAFTKYYTENSTHHIVFRTFDSFILNFYDFVVDTTAGKLMIQDGFIYDAGCLLSKDIQSRMLFNLMIQTNPESEVSYLKNAETLTQNNQSAKALSTLKEHKEALKEYPTFYQLYIANQYKMSPKTFINALDELQKDSLDNRYLSLHKLMYYANNGDALQAEAIINQLIPSTGDDPIYMFLYGHTLQLAGNYAEALKCYQMVDKSMPLIWDLWYSELQCFKKLKDTEGYNQCLQKGKQTYGMSDSELEQLEVK